MVCDGDMEWYLFGLCYLFSLQSDHKWNALIDIYFYLKPKKQLQLYLVVKMCYWPQLLDSLLFPYIINRIQSQYLLVFQLI